MSPPSSGRKNQVMEESSVKAGCIQTSRLGNILEYIGNRREMGESSHWLACRTDKTERTNRRQEYSNQPGP
jgi:hypothetical protein